MYQFVIALYYLKYLFTSHPASRITNNLTPISDFVHNVFADDYVYPEYKVVDAFRKFVQKDRRIITTSQHGARSKEAGNQITAGKIASITAVRKKTGHMLFRMAKYYRFSQIVELGTGLGISTLYLAMGDRSTHVITIEGNQAYADIASAHFNNLGLHHIKLICNTFENELSGLLQNGPGASLIFIDGNHTREATTYYCDLCMRMLPDRSMIVLDDINWSHGMHMAWNTIRRTCTTGAAIDLFHAGILFVDSHLRGENYVIRNV
jgi:predicted O-methyltransferase YrrM